MSRILIIEDDADIALSLEYSLKKAGEYTVSVASDGESGLQAARRELPDLVLLDLNLPKLDGLDVCRMLRGDESTSTIPIIMITARVGETDAVAGLELGADDYIAKPFSVKEAVARVRAVLRRSQDDFAGAPVLTSGRLRLETESRRVLVGEREIALTRKEFDLLATMMRQAGRVLTRSRILERVWGYDYPGETRTVDVHVRQLRKKLGDEIAREIETVVGVGYRFRRDDR